MDVKMEGEAFPIEKRKGRCRMPYFWLAMIILAIVVESATTQLVSIWFVAGGAAALIASFCEAPIWLQWVLFVAVTGITLIVTRPFVRKKLDAKNTSTNADRYIGKKAVVIVPLDNIAGTGQVKVLGSIWTARSTDNSPIPEGTDVSVQSIEGVKLIVTRADYTQGSSK